MIEFDDRYNRLAACPRFSTTLPYHTTADFVSIPLGAGTDGERREGKGLNKPEHTYYSETVNDLPHETFSLYYNEKGSQHALRYN